jgi:hypothetical protein
MSGENPMFDGESDGFNLPAFMKPIFAKIAAFNSEVSFNYLQSYVRKHPEATPQQVLDALENRYLALASSSGGAVGALAAVPGVTTLPALGASAVEAVGFTELSVFYILARAHLHGLPTDDLVRRQLLVMMILIGPTSQKFMKQASERTGQHAAKSILKKLPASAIRSLNSVVGKNFVTKYGAKQGILVLGRVLPLGIGAIIGGTFNALSAASVMAATDKFFGPVPDAFPWSPDDFGQQDPIAA